MGLDVETGATCSELSVLDVDVSLTGEVDSGGSFSERSDSYSLGLGCLTQGYCNARRTL